MLIDRLWNKIERDHYRRDFTSRVKCAEMPSVHGRVTVNATDVRAGKTYRFIRVLISGETVLSRFAITLILERTPFSMPIRAVA